MNGLIREEIVYYYTSNFLFNIHQYINIYLYSNIPRPLQEYFISWCNKRFRTIKENFQMNLLFYIACRIRAKKKKFRSNKSH